MTAEPPPGTARESRWRRWLMIASLTLNLLVLGFVAGAVLRGGPPGGPGPRVELTLGPVLRALAPEDRRAVAARLRAQRPVAPGGRAEMRRDMRALLEVLSADRFDAARMRAIMERQFRRLRALQGVAAEQLIAHLATMPAAERRALATRLEAELRHSRRPRAHRGPAGGD